VEYRSEQSAYNASPAKTWPMPTRRQLIVGDADADETESEGMDHLGHPEVDTNYVSSKNACENLEVFVPLYSTSFLVASLEIQ